MTDVYEFDADTHTYTINGKPATGVTSIIGVIAKPALTQWAANEAVSPFVSKFNRLTGGLTFMLP